MTTRDLGGLYAPSSNARIKPYTCIMGDLAPGTRIALHDRRGAGADAGPSGDAFPACASRNSPRYSRRPRKGAIGPNYCRMQTPGNVNYLGIAVSYRGLLRRRSCLSAKPCGAMTEEGEGNGSPPERMRAIAGSKKRRELGFFVVLVAAGIWLLGNHGRCTKGAGLAPPGTPAMCDNRRSDAVRRNGNGRTRMRKTICR